jgi:hypothetical protein
MYQSLVFVSDSSLGTTLTCEGVNIEPCSPQCWDNITCVCVNSNIAGFVQSSLVFAEILDSVLQFYRFGTTLACVFVNIEPCGAISKVW